jgi:hypothetical protein
MTDIPVAPPETPVVPPVPPVDGGAPPAGAEVKGKAQPQVRKRGYKLSTALFFALIAIVLTAGKLSERTFSLSSMWGVVALGMLAFVLALGFDLLQHPLGILISERNLMSLSRFQLIAWTVLICSAFVIVGMARVFAQVDDPLGITLPAELWQLLGISAASTVGASLVMKNKANKEPADEGALTQKVADQTNDVSAQAVSDNRQGIAYANATPQDARITDMFEGDELANTAYIDMSKVQMFFFTLVAITAYAVNLYAFMRDNTPESFTTFPALSPGLVAVLGISHAAYLGSKSVDKTQTT